VPLLGGPLPRLFTRIHVSYVDDAVGARCSYATSTLCDASRCRSTLRPALRPRAILTRFCCGRAFFARDARGRANSTRHATTFHVGCACCAVRFSCRLEDLAHILPEYLPTLPGHACCILDGGPQTRYARVSFDHIDTTFGTPLGGDHTCVEPRRSCGRYEDVPRLGANDLRAAAPTPLLAPRYGRDRWASLPHAPRHMFEPTAAFSTLVTSPLRARDYLFVPEGWLS